MTYKDHTFRNYTIVHTEQLSDTQISQIKQLINVCCRHDQITLSYPTSENEPEPAASEVPKSGFSRHWLAYDSSGMLTAVLGLVFYEDSLAECTAFTHPEFRRQGLFSALLDLALEEAQDLDILFPVSGSCPDTTATLDALCAELDFCELQMETELTEVSAKDGTKDGVNDGVNDDAKDGRKRRTEAAEFTLHHCSPDDFGTVTWQLFSGPLTDASSPSRLCGSCQTSPVSGSADAVSSGSASCVCLHHVEVLPQYRRQGCGTALMELLLARLARDGFRRVILQISGDNEAALSLYKKTGFRITETLSYYLY